MFAQECAECIQVPGQQRRSHPVRQIGNRLQAASHLRLAAHPTPHHGAEQVLSQPLLPRIDQHQPRRQFRRRRRVGNHRLHVQLLRQSGRRRDQVNPADQTADLVLPTAAGGQHLFQRQYLVKQVVLIKGDPQQFAETRQHRAAHDRTRPQPGPARDGGAGIETQPVPQPPHEFSDRLLRRRIRRDYIQHDQAGLEQRKRVRRVGVGQNFSGAFRFHALVDVAAIQHQARRIQPGRLRHDGPPTIQRHRRVEDTSAPFDAIGRGIGPAAAKVDAGGDFDAHGVAAIGCTRGRPRLPGRGRLLDAPARVRLDHVRQHVKRPLLQPTVTAQDGERLIAAQLKHGVGRGHPSR